MKVLLACEESQTCCIEFRNRGHEAYSCDIRYCSGGHKEWHIQDDVLNVIHRDWDLVIAFPPCTNLCVSGAKWFPEKIKNGSTRASVDFFMEFTKLRCRWAIENPIGIMSNLFRKPSQIIQPYEFGHPEKKSTCLWLFKLKPLIPTNNVYDEMMQLSKKEINRLHYLAPSPERAKIRSKTYTGIAKAMAEQWG